MLIAASFYRNRRSVIENSPKKRLPKVIITDSIISTLLGSSQNIVDHESQCESVIFSHLRKSIGQIRSEQGQSQMDRWSVRNQRDSAQMGEKR